MNPMQARQKRLNYVRNRGYTLVKVQHENSLTTLFCNRNKILSRGRVEHKEISINNWGDVTVEGCMTTQPSGIDRFLSFS